MFSLEDDDSDLDLEPYLLPALGDHQRWNNEWFRKFKRDFATPTTCPHTDDNRSTAPQRWMGAIVPLPRSQVASARIALLSGCENIPQKAAVASGTARRCNIPFRPQPQPSLPTSFSPSAADIPALPQLQSSASMGGFYPQSYLPAASDRYQYSNATVPATSASFTYTPGYTVSYASTSTSTNPSTSSYQPLTSTAYHSPRHSLIPSNADAEDHNPPFGRGPAPVLNQEQQPPQRSSRTRDQTSSSSSSTSRQTRTPPPLHRSKNHRRRSER